MTWRFVGMSRGCDRGWGCSVGPESGMISVSITFDQQGRGKLGTGGGGTWAIVPENPAIVIKILPFLDAVTRRG